MYLEVTPTLHFLPEVLAISTGRQSVHELGTEWGVLTNQEYALTQVLTNQEYALTQVLTNQEYALTQVLTNQEYALTQVLTNQEYALTQVLTNQEYALTQVLTNQEYALTQELTNQEYVLTQVLTNQEYVLTQVLTNQKYVLTQVLTNQEYVQTQVLTEQVALYIALSLDNSFTLTQSSRKHYPCWKEPVLNQTGRYQHCRLKTACFEGFWLYWYVHKGIYVHLYPGWGVYQRKTVYISHIAHTSDTAQVTSSYHTGSVSGIVGTWVEVALCQNNWKKYGIIFY